MWRIVALVTLVAGAPTELDNIDVAPINHFTFNLLNNVYAFQESFGQKNVVVSPLSIWSTFALLAEGSAGDTFTELMRGLALPNDLRATQALQGAVAQILKSGDKDVTLNRQAAIFSDRSLLIHPEFCQSANLYNTEVFSVDPSNTTKLAYDINYFICLATEGRIKEAITPELVENLRMTLVDALYFKASWTFPFDPTQTKQEAFYNSQGRTIGSVNMMYHKAPHNIGDSNSIGAQILEMTYGRNERFSMFIMLPFDGMPLSRMLGNLGMQSLDWMSEFRSAGIFPEIDCFIPRFKISSQLDLVPPLQYSGITRIFDAAQAELPGVSDSPLFVSKTIQNVEIEVNEEGTVAASSTIVGLEDRILGQRFEANKEFVFLVMDRLSGLVIFAGVYGQPSLV
ncbi:serine protease inhibitor-like [Epargyreus clarus]|uniref:serine protease inhibitor-like n=1 Tax=Epargyreus clarus TaxID=520877 RepID=UPI003C2C01EE